MYAIRQIIEDPQDSIPVPPELRHIPTEVIFIRLDSEAAKANPRAHWFRGYQAETDVDVWETLDESEQEPGVAFTTQGKPTLASLAGCWEGESLERGPQGNYETRQEFE